MRNQKFSAILKKTKVNFLLEATLFLQRTFEHILAFVLMQMIHVRKKHMREPIACVLRSLHGFPGEGCYLEWPRLQQAKHATSAKHLDDWDWTVSKCSDTNVVFQTAVFLIPVVRNNERSPGINSKTSDCLSRICLYSTTFLPVTVF